MRPWYRFASTVLLTIGVACGGGDDGGSGGTDAGTGSTETTATRTGSATGTTTGSYSTERDDFWGESRCDALDALFCDVYQTTPTPAQYDAWIDEVAFDDVRVGCVL